MDRRKGKRLFAYLMLVTIGLAGLQNKKEIKASSIDFTEHHRVEENTTPLEETLSEVETEIPHKDVRVIVELDEKSILEEANEANTNYSDLSEDFISSKKEELKKEQNKVLDEIKKSEISLETEEIRNYDTVLNGIALSVKEEDVAKLEEIDGVRRIYISDEFERPLLNSSSLMIGSHIAHEDFGYRGEGMVVAVVDTGVDYTHNAMKLEEGTASKLSETDVNTLIEKNHLSGSFFTEKIPYGYNYYDFNTNLYDSYGSMHGMHVAGIVGANDETTGIYGVAPNAQILAMKVFSDDIKYPTTFTDVWLNAIDDAISLKADVINMSLGSPAGFSIEGSKFSEIEMIEKARKAGVTVVIAAGNDGKITDGNTYQVDALQGNFDTALIANPSLNEGAISVASMENEKRHSYFIQWTKMMPGRRRPIPQIMEAEIDLFVPENESRSMVSGAWIEVAEDTVDLEETKSKVLNNFAVLELNTEESKSKKFSEMLKKVESYAPAAIVLYNEEKHSEVIGKRVRVSGEIGEIPVARIKRSTYQSIKDSLSPLSTSPTIFFSMKEYINPFAGKISTFSSWGPTPDLRIKPEVTAPGGAIYSTVEDNQYQNMSGTSMASPQVAGASALLRQHLQKIGIDENPANLIKLLLMNTAKPIVYEEETPYLVRQQGSGAIDLAGAINTTVVVEAKGTNDEVADGKLEFREVKQKVLEVRLQLKNFGTEAKTYRVRTISLIEKIENGRRKAIPVTVNHPQMIEGTEVSVLPGTTKEFGFMLDYSGTSEIEWNQFIEGYLRLQEVIDGEYEDTPALTVPFLAFYGNWGSAPAIDSFGLKEVDQSASGEVQFYVNKEEDKASSLFITKNGLPLHTDGDTVYFSTSSEYHQNILTRIAPLRNMESIEFSILDGETKETLRVLGKSLYVRKLSKLAFNNSFRIMGDSFWDGRINGDFVDPSKSYIYQIKVKLNTKGTTEKEEQIFRYWIKIDEEAPTILGEIEVTERSERKRLKNLKFRIKDSGTGIENVYINSVRYVKQTPGFPGLPPGFDNSAPGSGKKNSVEEEVEVTEFSPAKDTGTPGKQSTPGGTPKYGKYLRLTFVDKEVKDNVTLPSVVDGKVSIPLSFIPVGDGEDKQIFVNRNGHKNEEIEISTPYLADTTHIYISAIDSLSNKSSKIVSSGEQSSFHSINVLSFARLMEKNVELILNDSKMEKPVYDISGREATIQIKLPDDKHHLTYLSVKQNSRTTILLNNDRFQPISKNYDLSYDKASRTMRFTIRNILSNCEIVATLKDGPMPDLEDGKPIKIDLSNTGLTNFSEIRLNKQSVTVDTDNRIDAKANDNFLEFFFKEDKKNTDVRGVIIHNAKGGSKILRKIGGLEINFTSKVGVYSFSKTFAIKVKDRFLEDSSIEVVYAGSPSEQLLSQYGNDLVKDPYKNNSSKNKYPIIFLEKPNLLQPIISNSDRTIHIVGFVGKVKKEDSVKKIEIKLVDKKGRGIGSAVTLLKEDLLEQKKQFSYGGGKSFKGLGYVFDVKLPVTEYFANIRIEAETENGEMASIVRRTFYDLLDPVIQYEVKERSLDSDSVNIRIVTKDDSLSLKLYQGDSLVEVADKLSFTLSEGGVMLEKELNLPLKVGQNTFTFKAVDLTGFKVEKQIHIFRTKK